MPEAFEGTVRSFLVEGAIARVEVAGQREPIKIIGELAGLQLGESVRVEGEWEHHPRYGRQFRVSSVVPFVPHTAEGVARYLGGGLIPGIGTEMARRIVATLGSDAMSVMEADPERLSEVPGIGPKRAAAVHEALREKRALREVLVFLQGHGVSAAFAARIYRRYRDQAIQLVRSNPYRLAREISGIGFHMADRIARELGWAKQAPERIEAGLLHGLWLAAEEGHVYLPQEELVPAAVAGLEVSHAETEAALARLRASGGVIAEGSAVYSPQLHAAETELAARLRALAAAGRRGPVARPLERDLARLSDGQRRAVETACASALLVVTGGPGTGKTTIVNAIVAAYEAARLRVALAAPTGRAAKRLSEATGRSAKTVHRLLEWDGRSGFLRGPGAELTADLVVIDEASMLDVELAHALVRAVPIGAALVVVGDVDQLPSVGPGQVLRDLIDSGAAPVVRLTEIFRQARSSRIVLAAHATNAGRLPEAGPPDRGMTDYYFIRADDPARARELIVRLVAERIPARFELDPIRDVQVLAPMRRGDVGTVELGRALQQALNPSGRALAQAGRVIRVGDKVLQTHNDYERDVYNGDLGLVLDVDADAGGLVVEFDGRPVRYQSGDLGDLELAYAMTVHRAQGSEYPAVVMPVLTQHYVMLQRNLLYTGITRAKQLCVLVGSTRALGIAVRNVDTRHRRTRLAERLRG